MHVDMTDLRIDCLHTLANLDVCSCLFGRAAAAPLLGQIFYAVLSTYVAYFTFYFLFGSPAGQVSRIQNGGRPKPFDFFVTSA